MELAVKNCYLSFIVIVNYCYLSLLQPSTMRLPYYLIVFVFHILIAILPKKGFTQFREIYKDNDPENHIKGISFINSTTGFVAFNKFIGYTQDSGKTFTKYPIYVSNTDFNNYSVGLTFGFSPKGVIALSTDSLFVFGDYSFEPSILFSSNRGQSWKLLYHQNANFNAPNYSEGITDLVFPGNGAIGYAIHHEGILKTTNRGRNWSPIFSAPNHDLKKLSCPSTHTIYASGGKKLFKSSNGGSTWEDFTPITNKVSPNFNNVFFNSELIGYCTELHSSIIYKTINGGANWTEMNAKGHKVG